MIDKQLRAGRTMPKHMHCKQSTAHLSTSIDVSARHYCHEPVLQSLCFRSAYVCPGSHSVPVQRGQCDLIEVNETQSPHTASSKHVCSVGPDSSQANYDDECFSDVAKASLSKEAHITRVELLLKLCWHCCRCCLDGCGGRRGARCTQYRS
jgi:hypothetical protein